MIRSLSRILCAAALSACLALAQDLAAKLDQIAAGFQKDNHFMGSVLVAKGGKVILEKGYGMANVELGVPNTPDTKFRLGSITKQFTATAIMQLSEQHKLAVTDQACKYVDNCPDSWKPVTIRELLSHTSGIHSYTDDPQFPKPKFMRIPLSPIEVLMLTKDKPLDFAPGTNWKYDNTGYIFLGVIIEKISGEKYEPYLEKHIFAPLEMHDTGYDVTAEVIKNRAAGYSVEHGAVTNSDYIDMSLPYAAGSLYSTARDLYRWDRSLYTEKVISKASLEKMWTPVLHDYGYGWGIREFHNHKQIAHGGGINGFSTFIGRYPDDDAVVIVLSNSDHANAGAIASKLSETLFGVTP